jgi:hypothetical protein
LGAQQRKWGRLSRSSERLADLTRWTGIGERRAGNALSVAEAQDDSNDWHSSPDPDDRFVRATAISPVDVRLHYGRTLDAAFRARRTIRALVLGAFNPAALASIELVMTEMITPLLEDPGDPDVPPLEVRVVLDARRLCLSVAYVEPIDGRFVAPDLCGDVPPHGWGAHLIAKLSDRWGVEQHPGDCRIWVEFDR